MRMLLDTHAFLWFVRDDDRLSRVIKEEIILLQNEVLLSHASLWEIVIKASIGKLDIQQRFEELIQRAQDEAMTLLPIDLDSLALVATMPLHHRDPFDRLLIAQALSQNLPIVTRDPAFAAYPVEIIW
jgi:PIN domain nuclease of toxin-antitoxin system